MTAPCRTQKNRWARRGAKSALIGLAAAALAACSGVSNKLSNDTPSTSTSTTTIVPHAATTTAPAVTVIALYFARGPQIGVAHRTEPTTLTKYGVIGDLFAGPTPAEKAAGLSSTIPSTAKPESMTIVNGVAYLDVNQQFFLAADPTSSFLRVAQVVDTLTALPGIASVELLVHTQRLGTFAGIDLSKPLTRGAVSAGNGLLLLETPAVGDKISSPVSVSGVSEFAGTLDFLLVDSTGKVLFTITSTSLAGETFDFGFPFTNAGHGPVTLRVLGVRATGGPTQLLAGISLPLLP